MQPTAVLNPAIDLTESESRLIAEDKRDANIVAEIRRLPNPELRKDELDAAVMRRARRRESVEPRSENLSAAFREALPIFDEPEFAEAALLSHFEGDPFYGWTCFENGPDGLRKRWTTREDERAAPQLSKIRDARFVENQHSYRTQAIADIEAKTTRKAYLSGNEPAGEMLLKCRDLLGLEITVGATDSSAVLDGKRREVRAVRDNIRDALKAIPHARKNGLTRKVDTSLVEIARELTSESERIAGIMSRINDALSQRKVAEAKVRVANTVKTVSALEGKLRTAVRSVLADSKAPSESLTRLLDEYDADVSLLSGRTSRRSYPDLSSAREIVSVLQAIS